MKEMATEIGIKPDLLMKARERIKGREISCVVIRDGQIIHSGGGRGVAPLLYIYNNEKDKLEGSCVVDRIIGKAAAMILVLGKTGSAYGEVISDAARDYLMKRGVPIQYGSCVDRIAGPGGIGSCPIEASVLDIDEPEAGLTALTDRMAELRRVAIELQVPTR